MLLQLSKWLKCTFKEPNPHLVLCAMKRGTHELLSQRELCLHPISHQASRSYHRRSFWPLGWGVTSSRCKCNTDTVKGVIHRRWYVIIYTTFLMASPHICYFSTQEPWLMVYLEDKHLSKMHTSYVCWQPTLNTISFSPFSTLASLVSQQLKHLSTYPLWQVDGYPAAGMTWRNDTMKLLV